MAKLPDGEFLLPLFPLPNAVLLPKTLLPLHVFEPRYRELVRDAIASDQRIGIVLLRPGWEADYFGAPPVHEIGTVGMIEEVVELDDGKYNIVLSGVGRFRIVEQGSTQPYRIARVVAAPQRRSSGSVTAQRRDMLAHIAASYLRHLPEIGGTLELSNASLEVLTNLLVSALPLPPETRQEFLEMDSLAGRADRFAALLLQRLEALAVLAPFRRAADPSLN